MIDAAPALSPERLGVLATLPPDQPVIMLNLMEFREHAAYQNPSEACSGRKAYGRYCSTPRLKPFAPCWPCPSTRRRFTTAPPRWRPRAWCR